MNKRILVIDDSMTSLLLFESLFDNTGIEVLSEIESSAAIDKIRATKPDLIILDLMMPGVDGFQILESLKKEDQSKNIPVIILSAIHENKTIKKAMDNGAEGYIKKPIDAEEVLKTIYSLFGMADSTVQY